MSKQTLKNKLNIRIKTFKSMYKSPDGLDLLFCPSRHIKNIYYLLLKKNYWRLSYADKQQIRIELVTVLVSQLHYNDESNTY